MGEDEDNGEGKHGVSVLRIVSGVLILLVHGPHFGNQHLGQWFSFLVVH